MKARAARLMHVWVTVRALITNLQHPDCKRPAVWNDKDQSFVPFIFIAAWQGRVGTLPSFSLFAVNVTRHRLGNVKNAANEVQRKPCELNSSVRISAAPAPSSLSPTVNLRRYKLPVLLLERATENNNFSCSVLLRLTSWSTLSWDL